MAVDQGWPHQVALPAEAVRMLFFAVEAYAQELSACPRGHSMFHEGQWYKVYCFADPANAEQFKRRFGGEPFDPKDRGHGADWARWRKGT